MDSVTGLGLIVVAGLLAIANWSELRKPLQWIASMLSRSPKPDDESSDGDDQDQEQFDRDETHRVQMDWLLFISRDCESEGDSKGLELSAALALHLTERQFARSEAADE